MSTDPSSGYEPPATRDEDSQQLLSAAFEASPDGIIVLDPARRVVLCNRQAAVIAGFDSKSILGLPLTKALESSSLDWSGVMVTIDGGRTGDTIIRSARTSSILATIRRIPTIDGALMIALRDLAVFDHARRIATGERNPAGFTGTVDRKLRPDFARQRQLSPYLDRIIARGERALLQGARVIITGESGVGKTEIARYLHSFVSNASDPFVAVNCAAIPESLFESELFGYEKGAFTGALHQGKKGLIEAADGGTLFLDEVGEIPLTLQAKLLTFLEEGLVLRLGATCARRVNARVIAATNRDLLAMTAERSFRLDLYYRLAVVHMPIKPLREMSEMMDHLVERFVMGINQRRATPLRISEELLERLRSYHYPGNIRELSNLLQQISVLGEGEDDLNRWLQNATMRAPQAVPTPGASSLKDLVAAFEAEIIEKAIAQHGSKRKAAAALGVDIGTIVRKTHRKEP